MHRLTHSRNFGDNVRALALSFVALVFAASATTTAQETPALNWQAGPFSAPIGDSLAKIEVPAGYVYLDKEDTQALMELMGNPLTNQEMATVAPASDDETWFLVFEWDPMGWVDDSEKDDIDADAILSSIREGTENANKERLERGWSTMTILGWQEKPHYDEATNNLTWAIDASSDGDKIINRLVKLLGRHGVMTVTLVSGAEELDAAMQESDVLLAGYAFVPGSTYAEFIPGSDDVAKVGLTALVVGGAGAALLQSGLLARFWKLLVVGAAGLVAALKRLWNGEERA